MDFRGRYKDCRTCRIHYSSFFITRGQENMILVTFHFEILWGRQWLCAADQNIGRQIFIMPAANSCIFFALHIHWAIAKCVEATISVFTCQNLQKVKKTVKIVWKSIIPLCYRPMMYYVAVTTLCSYLLFRVVGYSLALPIYWAILRCVAARISVLTCQTLRNQRNQWWNQYATNNSAIADIVGQIKQIKAGENVGRPICIIPDHESCILLALHIYRAIQRGVEARISVFASQTLRKPQRTVKKSVWN